MILLKGTNIHLLDLESTIFVHIFLQVYMWH